MDTGLLKRKFMKLIGTIEEDRNFVDALTEISWLENEHSSSFSLSYYKGFCLFMLERYKEAKEVFLHALKLSESADLWFYLGKTYFYLNEFEESRHALRRSYIINDNQQSLLEIAKIFDIEGKHEEAIKTLQNYLKINQFDFHTWEFFEMVCKKSQKDSLFLQFLNESAESEIIDFLNIRKKNNAPFESSLFNIIKKNNGNLIVNQLARQNKIILGCEISHEQKPIYTKNKKLSIDNLAITLSRLILFCEEKQFFPETVFPIFFKDKGLKIMVEELFSQLSLVKQFFSFNKKSGSLAVTATAQNFPEFLHRVNKIDKNSMTFVLSIEWFDQKTPFEKKYMPDFAGIIGEKNTIEPDIDLLIPSVRSRLIIKIQSILKEQSETVKKFLFLNN